MVIERLVSQLPEQLAQIMLLMIQEKLQLHKQLKAQEIIQNLQLMVDI